MSTEPIDEAEIDAFRHEINRTVHVDAHMFDTEVRALVALILGGSDSKAVMRAVLDFGRRYESRDYTTAVFEETLRTWSMWLLHEANITLVPAYTRNIHSFLMACRVIGLVSPEASINVEQGGTDGDTAENGTPG